MQTIIDFEQMILKWKKDAKDRLQDIYNHNRRKIKDKRYRIKKVVR